MSEERGARPGDIVAGLSRIARRTREARKALDLLRGEISRFVDSYPEAEGVFCSCPMVQVQEKGESPRLVRGETDPDCPVHGGETEDVASPPTGSE